MSVEAAAFEQVFSLLKQFYVQQKDSDKPVVKYLNPVQLQEAFGFSIGEEGGTYEDLIAQVERYLEYSVRTGHPQFLNQLYGGCNFPALIGEMLTAFTNTSMYTYEVAPVATMMELELIGKMCSKAGFTNGEGSFVTGGSNTNLIAMLIARNEAAPDVKANGLYGRKPMTAFVSERSHYSFKKAANALGLGANHIIPVPTDKLGQIIPSELQRLIQESKGRGEQPFFVAATACTTELGAFDPIRQMSAVAKEEGLWLHVDGSWGGSIILSEKQRHRFDGIEQADSFSWNPHKMMNIPLICSAFLINHKGLLAKHLSTPGTEYIFHENDHSSCDLGPSSLQCGKRVDSLKLWLAWKFYGDEGYAKRIDRLFELAQYASKVVEETPNFELMEPTQTVNVNFRYVHPDSEQDPDALNEAVREDLLESGDAMVNFCHLDGGLSIRLILVNPDLTEHDLDQFFDRYTRAAEARLLVPETTP